MIDIPEGVAKAAQKMCLTFVNDSNFDDFKDAVLMASPSGEGQTESTALITHGRLLALRDLFDLLKRTAKPTRRVELKDSNRGRRVDPDLDDGRNVEED